MKLSKIFRSKSGRDVIQESTELRPREQLNMKVDLRLRGYPHQAEDIEGNHDAEDYIPQPLVKPSRRALLGEKGQKIPQ